jgi:glycosyltransferase involved in cell wall biosynthesis
MDLATFLVVHPYLDIYGGGERVFHNVTKTLLDHGQTVEVLTFDFDPSRYLDILGEEFPKKATVHSLGPRVEAEPPFTIYKKHRIFVKLLKKVRDQLDYDYLFSTQSSPPFEAIFLNKAKKNFAYVHFPEIHFEYDRATLKRKVYLWLFKRWVEQGVTRLDLVFCNSNFIREMIERYWKKTGTKETIVIYPPVNLDDFLFEKPLYERQKRVVYVARFIPNKRHELMKKLATDFPSYEFVSVGGLLESEKDWFNKFSETMPQNYSLKTNLPRADLLKILRDSRVYVHLMEGEHFGIAPVEGLASGCVTLVHNSGGMREFIPEEFRWEKYDDLKEKILAYMESTESISSWESKRKQLWNRISVLKPEDFQRTLWSYIQTSILGREEQT